MKAGADALPDYELLELLLFTAHARRDVKPLAKALLKRFGSFAEVISAGPRALKEVEGVGEVTVLALKTVQAAAVRMTRDEVMQRPVLANWQKLLDYCRASMAYEETERFRILYLNRKNVLIADEVQQKGTKNVISSIKTTCWLIHTLQFVPNMDPGCTLKRFALPAEIW